MFDDIKFKADCTSCGEGLDSFQSKDGNCVLSNLTPEELVDIVEKNDEGNVAIFYDLCSCGVMNHYKVTKNEPYTIERA